MLRVDASSLLYPFAVATHLPEVSLQEEDPSSEACTMGFTSFADAIASS